MALAGRPGVHTARWASGDPVGRMLEALAGEIARAAAGAAGFGFDPVFVPDGESRTVAELGDDWKRSHSHRARAAAELARRLASGVVPD